MTRLEMRVVVGGDAHLRAGQAGFDERLNFGSVHATGSMRRMGLQDISRISRARSQRSICRGDHLHVDAARYHPRHAIHSALADPRPRAAARTRPSSAGDRGRGGGGAAGPLERRIRRRLPACCTTARVAWSSPAWASRATSATRSPRRSRAPARPRFSCIPPRPATATSA